MDGTRSMGSRSSSRHGPTSTALFTGPVRRWKKAWAPIAPPAASSSSSTPSKIFLYKWVPLQTAGTKDEKSEEAVIQSARYVPVSIALQRKDASRRALEDAETPLQGSAEELSNPNAPTGLLIDDNDLNSRQQGSPEMGRQFTGDSTNSAGATPLDVEV